MNYTPYRKWIWREYFSTNVSW